MYEQTNQITLPEARQEASSVFLAKVFNWMAMGLGITGLVAFFTAQSGLARTIVASPIFFVLIIAELGLVFFLSARINRIQAGTASMLFVGYSILNGLDIRFQ
jgi:FtsH-binding integral membrane protein